MRQSDHKIKHFIRELQKQAAKTNFGDTLETQLRDWLTARIYTPNLQRELIQKPKKFISRN